MKKIGAIFILISLVFCFTTEAFAKSGTKDEAETTNSNFTVDAKSAILIETGTGKVLFEQNADNAASPASVTKIMTLLLAMEAIKEERVGLEDTVMISANAASMGGSQIFLEEGETTTLKELIKCAVIASANDAAVAIAEYVGGSEDAFVNMMNMRAKTLGLKNTVFENVTGLDDTTTYHSSSARDISIMSSELLKYPLISEFASLWQDTTRNGEFTLTNTNRLVRYYDGCNGLKTGYTSKAGYCISASAKRGNLELVAVIMGAETRDIRNAIAKELLDFGFANYTAYTEEETAIEKVPVRGAAIGETTLYQGGVSFIIPKSDLKKIEKIYEIPEFINAPIKENEPCGKIIYKIGEDVIYENDLYVKETVDKMSFFDVFLKIIGKIFPI